MFLYLFPSCLFLFSGSVLIVTSFSMLHVIMKSQNAILLVTEVSLNTAPPPHLQNFYCCIILTGWATIMSWGHVYVSQCTFQRM